MTVGINSYGMRYRDFSKDKKPGIYRVAVLGDSYTWGIGAADAERFTEKVEDLADHKVEMLILAYQDMVRYSIGCFWMRL